MLLMTHVTKIIDSQLSASVGLLEFVGSGGLVSREEVEKKLEKKLNAYLLRSVCIRFRMYAKSAAVDGPVFPNTDLCRR